MIGIHGVRLGKLYLINGRRIIVTKWQWNAIGRNIIEGYNPRTYKKYVKFFQIPDASVEDETYRTLAQREGIKIPPLPIQFRLYDEEFKISELTK